MPDKEGAKRIAGNCWNIEGELREKWRQKIERLEKHLRGNWAPTEKDIEWLYQLFRVLQVGGAWLVSNGSVFRKTGRSTLELQIVTGTYKDGHITLVDDVDKIVVMTKIIGEGLGITVKLEPHTLEDSHTLSV